MFFFFFFFFSHTSLHKCSEKCFTGSELTARLEPAFLAGLRSMNPSIRIKFMEIFSKSIRKRLYDRLMYIMATQNWEHMGNHYWIKQCLELLLNIVQVDRKMLCSSTYSRLPSCMSVLRQSSNPDGPKLVKQVKEELEVVDKIKTEENKPTSVKPAAKIKTEPVDEVISMEPSEIISSVKEEVFLSKYFALTTDSKEILEKLKAGVSIVSLEAEDHDALLDQLATTQGTFLKQIGKHTMGSFVQSLAQLSHRSTILAHKVWVDLFPQLWDLLDERHHQSLSGELGPFLSSGSHIAQMEGYKSSINTLVEGMSKCDPPIPIRPICLLYTSPSPRDS